MTKGTIIRMLVLFVALVNQGLVAFGYSPLPFDDKEVEEVSSWVFTTVTAIIAWWKDNDVTKKAIANKKAIKEGK